MLDKKQIEEKLISMFWNQQSLDNFVPDDMEAEESGLYFRSVENVRPFEGNLCTMDNGVIVDLSDGTQIRLIIQFD